MSVWLILLLACQVTALDISTSWHQKCMMWLSLPTESSHHSLLLDAGE